MKNTPLRLVRLNLQLRTDHLARLSVMAKKIAQRKDQDTRLAEALELSLEAALSWSDSDLLDRLQPDTEQPLWLALGPFVRTR